VARKCHDELREIAPHKLRKTQSHWNRLLGRLAELRDWQRFGSNTVREDLITAMQLLASSDLSINERTRQVRRLRNQWRDVDRKGGAPAEALLQRFNAAADEAFAPVVAHRDAQQQAREAAAAERSAFCDSIEQEYSALDWSEPDWPAIDARVRELREQWRKLGGVDKQAWANLNQRFLGCIKRYEEKLGSIRESEKLRRERLIKQVQRYASEPDLQAAISETLAAQQKWKPLVTASRSIEQRLWKEFRAACDAVFERRSAQNAELDRELGENADRKQALVDALVKLVELPAPERQNAGDERDRLVAEWNEIGQMPKARFREISDAWNKALKAFDRAEKAALVEVTHAYIDNLVDQSAQLDALEYAVCNGESVSTHDGFLALFSDRLAAIEKGGSELCHAQESNLERRNRLYLEMEVLLELDSPESYSDERRQWQLEHLSDAMTGGLDISPRERATALLQEACLAGAVPQAKQQEVMVRQGEIVSALKQ
jgi:exonuclease SbcC